MEGLIPDSPTDSPFSDASHMLGEKLQMSILRTRQSIHQAASRKSMALQKGGVQGRVGSITTHSSKSSIGMSTFNTQTSRGSNMTAITTKSKASFADIADNVDRLSSYYADQLEVLSHSATEESDFRSSVPRKLTRETSTEQYSIEGDKLNLSLRWIEHDAVKAVIIVVISLNVLALARETDDPTWPRWTLTNAAFLLVYMLEFVLRCANRGPLMLLYEEKDFHKRVWAWYELSLIVIGIVDLVSLSICSGPMDDDVAAGAYANDVDNDAPGVFLHCDSPGVRFLQLSRLLRVPRIVYLIPDLYLFVCMLVGMFVNVMVWIFLVIFLFCFVLAIILTRMLGHGMMISHTDSENFLEVHGMFADIPTSMFTLFQVTTVDDWSRIATPVITMKDSPFYRFAWRVFFILFITFMSWAMLSLLTAVASERVLAYTNRKKQDETFKQEIQRVEFIAFLSEWFLKADKDETGSLDKNEFVALMSHPEVIQNMQGHGIRLEDRDIDRTWEILTDGDDAVDLDIPALLDGLRYLFRVLQESLETKHVASVNYSLKRLNLVIDEDMKTMEESTDELRAQQDELMEHVRTQQKLFATQWARFLQKQSQDAVEALEEAANFSPTAGLNAPNPLVPMPEPAAMRASKASQNFKII